VLTEYQSSLCREQIEFAWEAVLARLLVNQFSGGLSFPLAQWVQDLLLQENLLFLAETRLKISLLIPWFMCNISNLLGARDAYLLHTQETGVIMLLSALFASVGDMWRRHAFKI
jgi:hypothetical protein